MNTLATTESPGSGGRGKKGRREERRPDPTTPFTHEPNQTKPRNNDKTNPHSCFSPSAAADGQNVLYLAQSDGMIAFVSDTYFRDLRCVYELASFCKLHQQQQQSKNERERQALGERLLLVSLDWPGILSPFKRAELSEGERAWLREFRCARARCAVPAERLIVMSAIREVWGSEAAFEAFVHGELPRVLGASKQRYSGEFVRVALRAIDTMFGG